MLGSTGCILYNARVVSLMVRAHGVDGKNRCAGTQRRRRDVSLKARIYRFTAECPRDFKRHITLGSDAVHYGRVSRIVWNIAEIERHYQRWN